MSLELLLLRALHRRRLRLATEAAAYCREQCRVAEGSIAHHNRVAQRARDALADLDRRARMGRLAGAR